MGDIGAVPVHVGVLEPEMVETRREPPDFLRMPIRQEITVLPADDPKKLKIGFTIHEYCGFAIYRMSQEMMGRRGQAKCDSRRWEYDENDNPVDCRIIKSRDDLHVGMKVLVKTLFDYDYTVGVVERFDDGKPYVDMGGCIGTLEFGGDDRECWVLTCVINKACLGPDAKTYISTVEDEDEN